MGCRIHHLSDDIHAEARGKRLTREVLSDADRALVELAGMPIVGSNYPNTLPVGIKFYRYTAGFLHQKVFLVDRQCAAVGTANLDNRSFRLNFELTLLNCDAGFVEAIEDMLVLDFDRSRPVELVEYAECFFGFRLLSRLARLLAPIL